MDGQKDEKVIKQGPIKHKDTSVRFSLERWKARIAVLRSLKSGRLQFVLLDNKGTEKYQVPIENYVGIYVNSKPDGNEKYSFALISEGATDSLAFETQEAMNSWGDVIQEKFGRVVIINITVPYRQHQLKQGLAMLILRDNAIAITTKDQPPKLQSSFLIRHIKHYGDFDEGFVFETGHKCPKGEKTYLIRCADNKKLYNLLDGLANRSITVQEIILKQKFSEIAISQGALPKAPIFPHSRVQSPSFNFGNLSSQLQLRQNKHENTTRRLLKSTSDVDNHKRLSSTKSALPYYNMESGQENYQNLRPDGQSIVPEVEYEMIPDDSPNVVTKGIPTRRGSVPVQTKNYNYRTDGIRSATLNCLVTEKSQRDSEYMNVDNSDVFTGEDTYVNTNPGTRESPGESYMNFEPACHSRTKQRHDSVTEYVNLSPSANEATLIHKVRTTSLPDDRTDTNFSKSLDIGHTSSEGQEETDGQPSIVPASRKPLKLADRAHSIASCDYTAPKLLPSTDAEQTVHTKAETEYENFTPLKTPTTDIPPTSCVQLPTVSLDRTEPAKGYNEMVTIKSPPFSADTPETVNKSVSQYEPANSKGYKENVSIRTPPATGDTPLPSEVVTESIDQCPQTEATDQYENFVPIKTTSTGDISLTSQYVHLATVSIGQTGTAKGYEDFVPVKTQPSTADTSFPSETVTTNVGQYPQTKPPSGYEDFVPVKTPSSTADTPVTTTSVFQYPQTELAEGYENFVPINTPSSIASTPPPLDYVVMSPSNHQATKQSEYEDYVRMDSTGRHSTEAEVNEEYSRLQFKHKENLRVSEQNDPAYSQLSHPSVESSKSFSVYSKLDASAVSKTGPIGSVSSHKDKPQVPSRNLKKSLKLYEPSSNFTTMIPPLPPRNHPLQKATDPPSPPPVPPAGPKPILSPRYAQSPITPPSVGPKPVAKNFQSAGELKYSEVEFTDIGQPKFRPRAKAIDQGLPSQHDTYAVIDRDASVGLQLALEQKKHDRL